MRGVRTIDHYAIGYCFRCGKYNTVGSETGGYFSYKYCKGGMGCNKEYFYDVGITFIRMYYIVK